MSLFTLSNGFKHLYISPLKHNSSPSLHYCMYSMYTPQLAYHFSLSYATCPRKTPAVTLLKMSWLPPLQRRHQHHTLNRVYTYLSRLKYAICLIYPRPPC
ncbi:uncharacterized protein YALI1_B25322g [Yarrowia lipolytica]|uniref:Uncharacterized protein n=1 Tax=Yarrowia lipolytica TaxID=4952 RepID=A0A1D8N8H6_YARLL|nr:hypothetical protein YALI1_B25322g [Yarrowia lipolytica]